MWCIPSYTYRYYVYINNTYDAPKEHHVQQILKTHPDIYITSLPKLMDESLQYFPKLFVDKRIQIWMFENVKVVYQLSNVVKWNKGSDYTESMSITRE